MTVFRNAGATSFRYDFWWRGTRYTGNTHQTTRADAAIVESDLRKKLRLQAGGLAPADPVESPYFQDWAEIYLDHVVSRVTAIKRPDRIEDLLRVVLRFWGRRPAPTVTGKYAAVAGAPYHDRRLIDPITDPKQLLDFDDWMTAKGLAGQTKNQYRSTLSQMYALALQPAFRKRTGVTFNPFVGIPRDRGGERTSIVSIEALQRWLAHASFHVRVALSIAALAPELRLANVLKLRWDTHIDRALQYITVHEHKTEGSTHRPLVVPIDDQLRSILEEARRRHRGKYVVTYRGKPVKGIRDGVQAAAEAAGLTWGRFKDDGVTFHTIRHTIATRLAELSDLDGGAPLSESQRTNAMGHKRLETTQRYTHIRPTAKRQALERLSHVTPIAAIVTLPWTRARRGDVGTRVGTRDSASSQSLGKTRKAKRERMTAESKKRA